MLNIKHLILFILTLFSAQLFAAETMKISAQQLLSLLAAPSGPEVVVLDVRSKNEFDQDHIKGAINVSHDQIGDNLALLNQHKDKMVVVYCRSGRRAGIAEEILARNGFKRLRHLDGDMKGWKKAELPTVASH